MTSRSGFEQHCVESPHKEKRAAYLVKCPQGCSRRRERRSLTRSVSCSETSNCKLSSRAASLSPFRFLSWRKKSRELTALFIYLFSQQQGEPPSPPPPPPRWLWRCPLCVSACCCCCWWSESRVFWSGQQGNEVWGRSRGGLLLTPTGAPEPLPLFIGTTGEHIKRERKTGLSGGTILNHFWQQTSEKRC